MSMINDLYFPESLSGEELDDYLSRGWFRMGQSVFTTDIVPLNGGVHMVNWLRIVVQKVSYGKKQKKLFTANSNLNLRIKPLVLSSEIEDLFTLYRSSVDFNAPDSVASFLYFGVERNIFDTSMIEVRDNDKLIAIGIFDNGDASIAGILNFYDPAYKSKSLGKYLMLLKINYAAEMNKTWYYPGYIARGYSKFDYKLFPDRNATEMYDSYSEEWLAV